MRRLMELDALLRQGKYPNCSSFAQQWEVSSKTIQRDIEYMKYQLGAPIEYDALKRGFYYTDEFFMLPSITMNEGELTALNTPPWTPKLLRLESLCFCNQEDPLNAPHS